MANVRTFFTPPSFAENASKMSFSTSANSKIFGTSVNAACSSAVGQKAAIAGKEACCRGLTECLGLTTETKKAGHPNATLEPKWPQGSRKGEPTLLPWPAGGRLLVQSLRDLPNNSLPCGAPDPPAQPGPERSRRLDRKAGRKIIKSSVSIPVFSSRGGSSGLARRPGGPRPPSGGDYTGERAQYIRWSLLRRI